jgi:hypothetical protein
MSSIDAINRCKRRHHDRSHRSDDQRPSAPIGDLLGALGGASATIGAHQRPLAPSATVGAIREASAAMTPSRASTASRYTTSSSVQRFLPPVRQNHRQRPSVPWCAAAPAAPLPLSRSFSAEGPPTHAREDAGECNKKAHSLEPKWPQVVRCSTTGGYYYYYYYYYPTKPIHIPGRPRRRHRRH